MISRFTTPTIQIKGAFYLIAFSILLLVASVSCSPVEVESSAVENNLASYPAPLQTAPPTPSSPSASVAYPIQNEVFDDNLSELEDELLDRFSADSYEVQAIQTLAAKPELSIAEKQFVKLINSD